jgi:hypothetical protein
MTRKPWFSIGERLALSHHKRILTTTQENSIEGEARALSNETA